MLLSARLLKDFCSINSFEVANSCEMYKGNAKRVYFQLIDASLDLPTQGFSPSGRRFVPSTGATLSVTLNSVDDAKKFVKTASKAFSSGDDSLWYIDINATDDVNGTVNMILSLNQSGVITSGLVQKAILVYPTVGI